MSTGKNKKVLLLSIKARPGRKCVNKDLCGGLGTATWVGDSWLARFFERVKRQNVILPELATAYLAAILRQGDWSASFRESVDGDDVLGEEADLVLVSVSIVDCNHELAVIKKLKNSGYRVGVYGTFASVMPEFFLADVDFIIKGEPEAGVLKIIASESLPSGVFEVEPVQDLDSLPFPDWSQFPVKKYSYSPALNKRPVLLMLASRGCPFSCSFYCPYSINSGKKYRYRSIKNVVDEMAHLKDKYGVRAIDFRDPIFTMNRQRALELAEEIIKRRLNIIWSCETRVDCLDKELIAAMHRSGLRHINIGIESFNEEVLKKSQRLPIKASHQEDIIKFCQSLGVTVAVFYILGLEDDTEATVEQTIAYAKKLNTLVAQFTVATPYPGTQFFNKLKDEGRLKTYHWEEYDTYNPVFEHKNLSREKLLRLKEKAFVSYYFRPAYLLRHMPKYFLEKFLWPF